MIKYEVESEYGVDIFENEHDVVLAICIFASYYGISLVPEDVKFSLDIHGDYYCELFPLSIRKVDIDD